MKNKLILILLSVAAVSQVLAQQTALDSVVGASNQPLAGATDYTVSERGPNHRIWQRITTVTNTGLPTLMTNSYTELESGMHYLDPVTGQWLESQEKFDLTRDGYAIARQGPSRVIISPVANDAAGSVDYLAPDGRRLRSTILGLSVSDRITGQNLMLAEITNSVGQQIAPN